MSRRLTQDGASLHRFLPLFDDSSSPTPSHPVSHAAVTSWNHLPLPSDLPPKVLDLTHIRLNADPSECEKIAVEAHSQLTKQLADCIARAPNLRVLDLDPVWHYNKDLRIFHPEHMVVIGDDGIKALCRSVSSADAARSYRAGTFHVEAPGSGFEKGQIIAVEAEGLLAPASPSPPHGSPSPSRPSPPADCTPAFSGLVAYPTCITVIDGGSSYREGSIVSLISLPSCPPINPPLQAIVTEVDAHGHVQSLELAVLRAFDSTSPAIELVAESGPTPLKKSLSARTGLKDALSPSKDPSPLTPSKDPSPVASDSPAAQPLPGTLRIKLQSFAPYAALFKVIGIRSSALSFNILSRGCNYVAGQELTLQPLEDVYSCATRARVLRVGDDGGIDELEVVQPAPEEFDGVAEQQYVLLGSSSSSSSSSKSRGNSARVTINRSSTGGLYSQGLEMISRGSRFSGKQGDYVAHAVDVASNYKKLHAGPANVAVVRICCGEADWLPSLQVIKLGCCDVGYHGVPFLAKAIRTLPLTTLHLRENVCIGSNFGCLAAALQFCTALTDLNLTSVSLGSHGAGVLSAILPSLSMLKQLHLTFNHLQASAVKQIAFELPRLVHMEKLFLSYNSLGEEGGEALAKSLMCLTKMTILHLKNCSLRGAGVKSIANALQHLTRMRRLAIENNGMFTREERVYESLAIALRKCHSLELLNVGHALEPHEVPVLFDAIRSLEVSGGRAVNCKVDNDQVNNMLEQYRAKSRSPQGSFSPTLAPKHSLQDQSDAERARVEAGIFMLNEIFPNDIIVHDCMNPTAKNHKDGTKAVISRASLIHLQAKDHRSLTTSPFNQTVCVKEMPYPPESDRERRIRFVSEVNAMASIRSKHTVPLLGIMFGVQGQEDSLGLSIGSSGRLPRESETQRVGGGDMKPLARISLVMPFYSLGSLGERLRHDKLPRLSWLHKLLLCWDIVSGIMDSHKAAVIHKDIKCDNIVLEQDALDLGDNTLLRGVVCDFGLANVAKQGDSTICGTREFIAPEIWEYKRQSSPGNGEGPYKAASDVYSLGMTFFEILTHKRPFMGLQQGGETLDFLSSFFDSSQSGDHAAGGSVVGPMFAQCVLNDIQAAENESRSGNGNDKHMVPEGFKGLIMLCIRRAPEERPSLSKIRRLLHRITISFIDQKKREIDREIEREFSSLFDEPPQMGSPTPQPRMSPPGYRSGLSFEQGRGRLLVVTDDMREEQEPATMKILKRLSELISPILVEDGDGGPAALA